MIPSGSLGLGKVHREQRDHVRLGEGWVRRWKTQALACFGETELPEVRTKYPTPAALKIGPLGIFASGNSSLPLGSRAGGDQERIGVSLGEVISLAWPRSLW